jgi:hypothetical protein
MTHAAKVASQSIQDAAARLVAERRDLPAGSVLRCFCRSVRRALLRGCPPEQVASEAERMTREVLARRPRDGSRPHALGQRATGPRVPVPRAS